MMHGHGTVKPHLPLLVMVGRGLSRPDTRGGCLGLARARPRDGQLLQNFRAEAHAPKHTHLSLLHNIYGGMTSDFSIEGSTALVLSRGLLLRFCSLGALKEPAGA